jgi:hypothetical protein
VSVVITTFNTGRYLPETLESVFAQSHPDLEVIVVDDGSTDDSVERARAFGDRVRVITRAHEGLGPARNAGIEVATGDYLAFLDSDDLWERDALAVQVAVATRNPDSGLIVMDGVVFDEPDGVERPLYVPRLDDLFDGSDGGELTGSFHRLFVERNWVTCPAQTLVPRSVQRAIGPVSTTPHGAQDYDYYLRISRSFPITLHRARLARWRFRPDSMSGDVIVRPLRWRVQGLRVIAQERDAATPDARAYVDAAYRAQVRAAAGVARMTLLRGDDPDPDDLHALVRIAPHDPYVIGTRALQLLPPAARRALGSARARLRR